jgi:hypothetical protein
LLGLEDAEVADCVADGKLPVLDRGEMWLGGGDDGGLGDEVGHVVRGGDDVGYVVEEGAGYVEDLGKE